jgi:hypothetical protein
MLLFMFPLYASCFLLPVANSDRASPRKKEDGSGVGVPEDYVLSGQKAVAAVARRAAGGEGARGEGEGEAS